MKVFLIRPLQIFGKQAQPSPGFSETSTIVLEELYVNCLAILAKHRLAVTPKKKSMFSI